MRVWLLRSHHSPHRCLPPLSLPAGASRHQSITCCSNSLAYRALVPLPPPAAFELLSRLPQHGLGSKLSRTSWTDDCFWTVQKVRMSPVRPYS